MISRKIVTAADSKFFYGLLTLLTTFYHMTRYENYKLEIWDLGLTDNQLNLLRLILRENWTIRSIEELGPEPFPGAFKASERNFAWKPYCISNSYSSHVSLLWLDAGVAISQDLNEIFCQIEENNSLFIQNGQHKNKNWISPECFNNLQPTFHELESFQIHANILGFGKSNSIRELLSVWQQHCSIPANVVSSFTNHRHDQTVLSLEIAKRDIRIENEDMYLLESANFKKSTKRCFFLAHRQSFNWVDFNSLINNNLLQPDSKEYHSKEF